MVDKYFTFVDKYFTFIANTNIMFSSSDTTSSSSTAKSTATQRRVGRVERWLRKGYGFIIDMGRLDDSDDSRYGWVKDELTGEKAFVYHNALQSDTENVFHRLFANEYVEFSVDLNRPRHDGRLQAFKVTGINGSELLCDLNAAAAAADENSEAMSSNNNNMRSRRSQTVSTGVPPMGANVQYVYYVPAPQQALPQATMMPQQAQQQGFPPVMGGGGASEPSYVMPASGIPVPK
jgi:hypothetical protein